MFSLINHITMDVFATITPNHGYTESSWLMRDGMGRMYEEETDSERKKSRNEKEELKNHIKERI